VSKYDSYLEAQIVIHRVSFCAQSQMDCATPIHKICEARSGSPPSQMALRLLFAPRRRRKSFMSDIGSLFAIVPSSDSDFLTGTDRCAGSEPAFLSNWR